LSLHQRSFHLPMDHCTIYNHQLIYENIVEILNKNLPNATKEFAEDGEYRFIEVEQKGRLFSKGKTLKINYRERVQPSYKLGNPSCPLEQNLTGMLEFVSSIPANNTKIHELFMEKIATINCEIVFSSESGYTKEATTIFREICQQGEPFIFAQPGKYFKKSKGQHFLNYDFQLLFDIRGNSEVDELTVKADSTYYDNEITESDTATTRKEATQQILETHHIKQNLSLPVISEDIILRDKYEVLDRIYALVTVAAKGEGVPPENLGKVMERLEIVHFSEQEKVIMSKELLSDQEKANATWRYESLYTLLWAIGKVNELPYPSQICPVEVIVSMILKESREEFTKSAQLRTNAEVLDQLDLIYRMNWACVTARINNEEVTGSLIPSVVYERHYALNWFVSYQDQEWDYVSTDT